MNFLILIMITIIANSTVSVHSPSFIYNGPIPLKYTCEGENINPEIDIAELPEETKSMALIVDDPDAPNGTFVHWVMWNIPPVKVIRENSSPGIEGKNGKMENKYQGPCPPSGVHHYHFHIYALDSELNLDPNTDKSKLVKAMNGHILGTGELIGTYTKQSNTVIEY
jgi:Raf kinase inhibitor-like YbhB/YbcL family protein